VMFYPCMIQVLIPFSRGDTTNPFRDYIPECDGNGARDQRGFVLDRSLLMQDGVMPINALDQVLRLPLYCGWTAAVSEFNEEIQSSVLDCSVQVQDDGTNYTDLFHCLHYHILLLHWMSQDFTGDYSFRFSFYKFKTN
jgi:hypothetical protein